MIQQNILKYTVLFLIGIVPFFFSCETVTTVTEDPVVAVAVEAPPISIEVVTIYFDANSPVISADAEQQLDALDALLKQNIASINTITITGHAAFAGTEQWRKLLSEQRGENIANYIMNKGIDSTLIAIIAKSANEPVTSNDTRDGRALNRRVTIVVE